MRQASYAYRRQKLLAGLPQAYESCCQRCEWGIAQLPCDEEGQPSMATWYNESILEGRERLGEPRDFEF